MSDLDPPDTPSGHAPVAAAEDDRAFTAGGIARPEPAVRPDTPCADVVARFTAAPDLNAVAVVDGASVVGLVDRAGLLTVFARPLMADLYARRPIRLLMDSQPLTVDAGLGLGEVGQRIAHAKPAALVAGFVVTDGGRYRGVATALDLMARSVEHAELRSRQLEEARHAAETANRAKTAFLANASHEIRTPLNAIMGFAEILHRELLGPLGSDLYREYAGDIMESGRHLMELINDLLDLSKAEADKLELSEGPVDVPRVVAACVRLMSERAARARVRIDTGLPASLVLLADERKLRQMLLNLLSNALKFTGSGGTVTVAAAVAEDGALRLSVADSGVGMTPEEMEKALEPWSRIDTALNRKLVGTGLGLPLTRRMVELHGGRLEMTSAPGAGTAVVLVFPAGRVAPAGAAG